MIILSSFSLRFLTMKHHEPLSRKNLVALSLISYIPGIVYAVKETTHTNDASSDLFRAILYGGWLWKL